MAGTFLLEDKNLRICCRGLVWNQFLADIVIISYHLLLGSTMTPPVNCCKLRRRYDIYKSSRDLSSCLTLLQHFQFKFTPKQQEVNGGSRLVERKASGGFCCDKFPAFSQVKTWIRCGDRHLNNGTGHEIFFYVVGFWQEIAQGIE